MNVAEIKAKLPQAEVYEINPDATYLLVVNDELVGRDVAIRLAQELKCWLIMSPDPENTVRLLEMKE